MAGTSGLGTQNRLNLELLKVPTGRISVSFLFRVAEKFINLLGGHVDLTFTTLIVKTSREGGKTSSLGCAFSGEDPGFL